MKKGEEEEEKREKLSLRLTHKIESNKLYKKITQRNWFKKELF